MRFLILFLFVGVFSGAVLGQIDRALPYEVDLDFFDLPDGGNFGQTPGVAVNSSGTIYVFTRGEAALLEFDSHGKFVRDLAPGMFQTPHGLRVDVEDNIWTTDVGTHQVLKLDPDGKVLMVFGIKGNAGTAIDADGLKATLFNQPTDIAFDRYGNLYVADGYGNSRVVKFDPDGKFVKAWGEMGAEPGQFNLPHSILVDTHDRVWVADRNNSRIQLFDLEGNFLSEWSHAGRPWGFEQAGDGDVWVADGTANRILKLDLDGQIVGGFGEPGQKPGQLGWVHYLAEADDGSILVGEIVNQRAQRFLRSSKFDVRGSGVEPAQIAEAPEIDVLAKEREGWSTAYANLDAEGTAAYFADHARIYHPGRPMVQGKENILAYFEERTSFGPFTITFTDSRSWSMGDRAVDVSDYRVDFTDSDGNPAVRSGRYIMLYEKSDDGRWLVTHDLWNFDK